MARRKTAMQFAICVNTDDADLLTPRMIYRVFSDESAAKSEYIRVVDNEGEDYLYPADYFVFVSFPQVIEKTLGRLSNSKSLSQRQHRASSVSNKKARSKAA